MIFTISVIAWLLAMTIYIRGKFRADLITIITPWHQCIVIAGMNGRIARTDLSPWPGD
jgi:hypothetical protein